MSKPTTSIQGDVNVRDVIPQDIPDDTMVHISHGNLQKAFSQQRKRTLEEVREAIVVDLITGKDPKNPNSQGWEVAMSFIKKRLSQLEGEDIK